MRQSRTHFEQIPVEVVKKIAEGDGSTDENEPRKKNQSRVVHDYGDICQAITEVAVTQRHQITNEEFHTLNRCHRRSAGMQPAK
jgi:hypothetical protein